MLDKTKTHCGCENAINMAGKKIGRLTVVSRAGKSNKGSIQWLCKCECGNTKVIDGYLLRTGMTQSCGCLHSDRMSEIKKKYNDYEICGQIVYVDLPKSDKKMICDVEDWNKYKHLFWRVGNNGYACSNDMSDKGTIYFHQEIIECPDGMYRDHINRERLDNRKCNLRIVHAKENVLNRGVQKNNSSGFRGVSYLKRYRKYVAQITHNRKNYCLGRFENIEDAVKARFDGEMKYFGKIVSDVNGKSSE